MEVETGSGPVKLTIKNCKEFRQADKAKDPCYIKSTLYGKNESVKFCDTCWQSFLFFRDSMYVQY